MLPGFLGSYSLCGSLSSRQVTNQRLQGIGEPITWHIVHQVRATSSLTDEMVTEGFWLTSALAPSRLALLPAARSAPSTLGVGIL